MAWGGAGEGRDRGDVVVTGSYRKEVIAEAVPVIDGSVVQQAPCFTCTEQ